MNRFYTKAGHTEEDYSILGAAGNKLNQVHFAEQQLLPAPQGHKATAAAPSPKAPQHIDICPCS